MVLVQDGAAYIVSGSNWAVFKDLLIAGLRPHAKDFGARFGPAVEAVNWPFIQDEAASGDGDGSDFVILNGSSAVSYSYSSFVGEDPETAPLGRYADADRMVEEFEAAVSLPLSLPFADDGAWFERVGIRITLP